MPDDFDLACVPLVGALAPLAAFVGIGARVRVLAERGYCGSYWGTLRSAHPAPPDAVWFWMDVEPGQVWNSQTKLQRAHLDAVDLLRSGDTLTAVIRWLQVDPADENVLAALRAKDVPWSRPYWRRGPGKPTVEKHQAEVEARQAVLAARLGLSLEATPAQLAPLLGGEHDADARLLIRAMIRRHRLESGQMHAASRRVFEEAQRVREESVKQADARFEMACSFAALLESP